MAAVHSENTQIEILVRRYLWSNGIRYRLHPAHLPGKPDIVIPRYKLAIFVHGCFWHGHENLISVVYLNREWNIGERKLRRISFVIAKLKKNLRLKVGSF